MDISESIDKLAPALVAAQAECGAVAKSGYNKFDRYEYATLADYVAAVRPILAKHGLAIIFDAVLDHNMERTTSQDKKENGVFLHCNVTIIHASGQYVRFPAVGEGQDRGDKGTYKALTGARKYALAGLFNLATADEPETATAPPPKAAGGDGTLYNFSGDDADGLIARMNDAIDGKVPVANWREFCNSVARRATEVTKQGTPERTALIDLIAAARAKHVNV